MRIGILIVLAAALTSCQSEEEKRAAPLMMIMDTSGKQECLLQMRQCAARACTERAKSGVCREYASVKFSACDAMKLEAAAIGGNHFGGSDVPPEEEGQTLTEQDISMISGRVRIVKRDAWMEMTEDPLRLTITVETDGKAVSEMECS